MSRELKPCGTVAAARRHMKAGEELCGPCLEARRRYDRERRPRRTRLQPCGTNAAYQRHLHHGEEPCDACREAARETGRKDWERRKKLKPCGTVAAYHRHLSRKETPCGPCMEAVSAYNRERWARKRRELEELRRSVPPDDAHRAPCVANPRLWDSRGEGESAADARRRYRVAVKACRTECPVFAWCDANAPRVAGVVAGVVS